MPELLRKIPEGAEAFAVLVGAVDFLEYPVMGFVRLSEGRRLGNLTEVPLPGSGITVFVTIDGRRGFDTESSSKWLQDSLVVI